MGIATSLIDIAKLKGLSPTETVRLTVHCSDDANTYAKVYNVWVSYTAVANVGDVWVNADPASPNYGQIIYYLESGPRVLPETETLCDALIGNNTGGLNSETQQYVDQQINIVINQIAESNGAVLPPVQDVQELKAIDITPLADKTTCFVEDNQVWYSWDIQSTEPDDLYNVVIPNFVTGSGRWKLVLASHLDGGDF